MGVLTFGQFLHDAASEGEVINTLFEERLFDLVGVLQVRMKPSAYGLKDQVHTKTLDAAGLITPAIEAGLRAELTDRLRRVREAE